jgi:hypothetical protein
MPKPSANRKKDLKKLATYLSARTDHRFRRKAKTTHNELQWRSRLYVLAVLLAAVGAWSLWREFC